MKVAREAVYRVPDGEELRLDDLSLVVAHLQTVGQAPPDARVKLRVDMIVLTWETEQETAAELTARLDDERAEREARRNQPAELAAVDAPAEDWDADAPAEVPATAVRARRG